MKPAEAALRQEIQVKREELKTLFRRLGGMAGGGKDICRNGHDKRVVGVRILADGSERCRQCQREVSHRAYLKRRGLEAELDRLEAVHDK